VSATSDTPTHAHSETTIVTAAVLIIGNEILSGRTQDTNLNFIALTLGEWGIRVAEARIIADDENEIVDSLNELRTKNDYVFTTGGIGPTHDDITASCIAKAFGVPLVEHEEIAALIRSREAPPDIMRSRLRMALVPEGAGLIANGTGGPPGFCMMLPSLKSVLRGGDLVVSRSVSAFLAESEIADGLTAVQNDYPDLSLGSYPFMKEGRYGTNLVVRGTDEQAIDAALRDVVVAIRKAGGEPVDPA